MHFVSIGLGPGRPEPATWASFVQWPRAGRGGRSAAVAGGPRAEPAPFVFGRPAPGASLLAAGDGPAQAGAAKQGTALDPTRWEAGHRNECPSRTEDHQTAPPRGNGLFCASGPPPLPRAAALYGRGTSLRDGKPSRRTPNGAPANVAPPPPHETVARQDQRSGPDSYRRRYVSSSEVASPPAAPDQCALAKRPDAEWTPHVDPRPPRRPGSPDRP
jgi:hypothetical protein